MKKTVLLLSFVLWNVAALAQTNWQGQAENQIRLWQQENNAARNDSYNRPTKGNRHSTEYEKSWKEIAHVTRADYLLVSEGGEAYYLGERKITAEKKYIRDGQGVCVEKMDTAYVAYSGQFKRDSRHGGGLLKQSDGSVIYGIWKWDKLKKGTERPASAEEIEKLEKDVIRIEKAVGVVQKSDF